MITTWRQSMYRAVQSYVRQNVLDEDRIRIVKRALYFGEYKVAIHFGPTVSNWTDYNDLHESIVDALMGWDYRLVSSSKALYFNVYTNHSSVARKLMGLHESLEFSSIDVLNPSCWEIKHGKPKNRGLYFHKYRYRVRVSDSSKLTPDSYVGLMWGAWVVSRNFFYCVEVKDLLMLKLLHSGYILEINERH